jgi:hypothetical protein
METCSSQVRDGALVSGGLLLKDRVICELFVGCYCMYVDILLKESFD